MRRHVLLFGLAGGVLITGLRFIEYRWLVVEHAVEIYGGLVAAAFAGVGLWLGRMLTRPPEPVVVREVVVREVVRPEIVVREVAVPASIAFVRDEAKREALGITARELEILALIAEGLSNKEIAARACVSENTVKTHSSRVFDKLGARRRTEAVRVGKALRLIP